MTVWSVKKHYLYTENKPQTFEKNDFYKHQTRLITMEDKRFKARL
jgi:hypothetical protein